MYSTAIVFVLFGIWYLVMDLWAGGIFSSFSGDCWCGGVGDVGERTGRLVEWDGMGWDDTREEQWLATLGDTLH